VREVVPGTNNCTYGAVSFSPNIMISVGTSHKLDIYMAAVPVGR
jgi:hypothetical protein